MQNKANSKARPPRKQRGNALLIFFLLVAMGMLSLLVSKLNSQPSALLHAESSPSHLNQARQALLGHIQNSLLNAPVADARLPTALAATDTIQLGRLDYAGIGLGKAGTTDSELWYVATGFPLFDTTPTHLLTQCNTNQPATTSLAAIIIAPGPALPSQTSRSSTASASQYMEGLTGTPTGCTGNPSNADTPPDSFLISASTSPVFNDRLATISRADILEGMAREAYRQINLSMSNHAATSGSYPSSKAGLTGLPTWLASGAWFDEITYDSTSVAPDVRLRLTHCYQIQLHWDNAGQLTTVTPLEPQQCS
ncbi:hypothetical protein GCM10007907_28610 [Chitinimonas prasina]|uniref:Uncharacterized protein n=2 Tax=Chitinimonas prasina TaxID=1434937 RepID=A0ABQ5YLD0_9NEIS|nr:hypothetical protein GCM10007907_28610 [Chitinimonas prasina]